MAATAATQLPAVVCGLIWPRMLQGAWLHCLRNHTQTSLPSFSRNVLALSLAFNHVMSIFSRKAEHTIKAVVDFTLRYHSLVTFNALCFKSHSVLGNLPLAIITMSSSHPSLFMRRFVSISSSLLLPGSTLKVWVSRGGISMLCRLPTGRRPFGVPALSQSRKKVLIQCKQALSTS